MKQISAGSVGIRDCGCGSANISERAGRGRASWPGWCRRGRLRWPLPSRILA